MTQIDVSALPDTHLNLVFQVLLLNLSILENHLRQANLVDHLDLFSGTLDRLFCLGYHFFLDLLSYLALLGNLEYHWILGLLAFLVDP